MLYVDIFPEPNIKGALNMLRTYRDEIDNFIMLPGNLRIVPCLTWATLNFGNPTIGKDYYLYTKEGKRALNIKLKPLSISWQNRETIILDGYDVRLDIVASKICPSSSELNVERLHELLLGLFG